MSELTDDAYSPGVPLSGHARPTSQPPLPEAPGDVEAMRHKLRMIISHATGGKFHKPEDVDRSVNDICVQITQRVNVIYEAGKEAALPLPKAKASGDVELREALAEARRGFDATQVLITSLSGSKSIMVETFAERIGQALSRPEAGGKEAAEGDGLRDIIKQAADAVDQLAFRMPPPNEWTPQFASLAQSMRTALQSLPARHGVDRD